VNEPIIPAIALNNGVTIPQFGLGVWRVKDGQEVIDSVSHALQRGYRLIDTAAMYGNERGVGQAIQESAVAREEVFVTTKLWNDSHDYDTALRAFDSSLDKLGLDYLDLYLVHWPVPAQAKFTEAWRALERLYDDKRVRAIGVCNFKPPHLEQLLSSANIVPAVNQVELHPRLQQHEIREFCKQYDIAIESWSPLMRGGELLANEGLQQIAAKYEKSTAQVILRWHIDSGFIVIPKSSHAKRIDENYDIFDFELDDHDMAVIAELDDGTRVGPDPDSANFT
jgi:diketogulonate reductase-like aldo/keto reductase